MRFFSEEDKNKKNSRISMQKNPCQLPDELLAELETKVQASVANGYLSCPIAWKIAKNHEVPKIAIGEIADRLGIRVTNCQLGCFKIEKTLYQQPPSGYIDGEIGTALRELHAKKQLNCEKIFDLSREYKLKPLYIANEMTASGLKIQGCQLGCF